MSDAGAEYVVEHVKVRVRAAPSMEAEIVDILCLGDLVFVVEVVELSGETWARLAKGMELRCDKRAGSAPKVHMKLPQEGFVPINHPRLGKPLKRLQASATAEDATASPAAGTLCVRQRGSCAPGSALWPCAPAPRRVPEARASAGGWLEAEEVRKAVARAAEWIASADAIVVGSGAGMGIDSGLSAQIGERPAGAWPGLKDLGLAYEDMCHAKWFVEDPRLAWSFWRHCARTYEAAQPHAGYRLVQEWACKAALGSFSFTSNIDGHWEASGWDQERIVEFHGVVRWLQCSKPCCQTVWEAEAVPEQGEGGLPEAAGEDKEDKAGPHRLSGKLPTCERCGAAARPAVQMFGRDAGFSKERRAAQLSRYDGWLKQLAARPDYDRLSIICLELGCGPAAPAVRKELEAVMRRFPAAKFVRMNTEHPGLVHKDLRERGVSLPLKVNEGLHMLQEQLEVPAELVTFVLWDEDGDSAEVVAPIGATIEQVLRLARRVPGVELIIRTGASARVVHALAPGEDVEVQLNSPVPKQMIFSVQEARKATAIVLQGVQITSGMCRKVEQRISTAIELLNDLNRIFGSEEYQAEVRLEKDPQGVEDLIMAVHAQVLPRHGLGPCEVQVMQARIGLVLGGSKEVEEKANWLVNLAYAGQGPALEAAPAETAGVETPCPTEALPAAAQQGPETPTTPRPPTPVAPSVAPLLEAISMPGCVSPSPQSAVATPPSFAGVSGAKAEAEQGTMEVSLVRLATEGSGKRQRLPMMLPASTTIGDIRRMLCEAQGFSEEVGKMVRFQMSKGEGRFRRMNDDEPVVPEIFMAKVPPLTLPSEDEAPSSVAESPVVIDVPQPGTPHPSKFVPAPEALPSPVKVQPGKIALPAAHVAENTRKVVSGDSISLLGDDLWQCLALVAVNRWDAACVPLCLTLCFSASMGGLSVAASVAICICSLLSLLASTVFGLSVALSLSSSTSVSLVRVASALCGLPVGQPAEKCFSSQSCLRASMHMCPSIRPFICLLMQL